MAFSTPEISYRTDDDGKRIASIVLRASDQSAVATVWFYDAEQPDETGFVQNKRILARARELFAEASAIPPKMAPE